MNYDIDSIVNQITMNGKTTEKLNQRVNQLKMELSSQSSLARTHNLIKRTPMKSNKELQSRMVDKQSVKIRKIPIKGLLPKVGSFERKETKLNRYNSIVPNIESCSSIRGDYIRIMNTLPKPPLIMSLRHCLSQNTHRVHKFKVNPKWEKEKIEDLPVTRYTNLTIREKKLQFRILIDKLLMVNEKWYKLNVILSNGIKVLIKFKIGQSRL